MAIGVGGNGGGTPKPGTTPSGPPAAAPREEVRRLAQAAQEARLLSQIDACKVLEKQAFRMAELAREANLGFLAYLFEMARVASVDERTRLSRL